MFCNKKLLAFVFLLAFKLSFYAQSFSQGDIVINGNIGTPHLFKKIIKVAANSAAFKNNFGDVLEISAIKGFNPVALKAEFGINEVFGLGINYSFWNVRFDVKDYYNIQNQNTIVKDSADVYGIKISSKSFGIRPNFHFPFDNPNNDLYIGVGLGFTSNNLSIDFSSTDAGRYAKSFNRGLGYSLSLPGGFYFAPSLGFRHYLNPFFGLNFEIGYEKGAILQAGLVVKFNAKKAKDEKNNNNNKN
jgi:hypothetical protein